MRPRVDFGEGKVLKDEQRAELWGTLAGGHGYDAVEGFEDGGIVRPAMGEALHADTSAGCDERVMESVQLFKWNFARLVGYGTW